MSFDMFFNVFILNWNKTIYFDVSKPVAAFVTTNIKFIKQQFSRRREGRKKKAH